MTATTIRVQMAQRKDTAANWTAANPILLSGEIGYETDTEKFKIGDGTTNWNSLAYLPIPDGSGNLTITGNLEIGTTGTLTFEGSTADGFETTLAVTDPTADRTITLPDVSGTVVTTGDTGSVTSTMIADGTIVNADVSDTAEIAVSKLANGTANQVLVTDGTDVSWSDDLTLAGNLTVNGTTTTVNTETLVVEDKNIELGVVGTPTDLTADGGGITLKGTTDKTINWVDATDSWTSSEHVDLASGKSYRINGTEVLSSTTLGSGVTGSSLTSVGTLGSLTVTGSATAGSFIPTSSTVPTNGVYLPAANSVALSTNGTGRLFVDASGNVGVGTASPSSVFNINAGSSRLTIDHASASAIELKRSSTGSETRISLNNTADSKAAQIRVNWAGQSFGAFEYWVPNNTSNGQTIVFQAGTDNTIVYGGTAGIERLRITSAGLVGIGTSAPGTELEVAATSPIIKSRATGNNTGKLALDSNRASSVVGGQIFGQWNGNTVSRIDFINGADGTNKDDGEIAFATSASTSSPQERLRIDSSGRLLVGTSSDSGGALLQVNGDRIRVATAKTPASASDTGTTGEICWDASYIYVCTATNTWKRAALSTW